MRREWSLNAASSLLALTMAIPLYAQTPAPKENPCGEVEMACKNAGFVEKGSEAGKGLWSECIDPIMQGKTVKAAKPLPKVSPQTVAACKAKNPTFGRPENAKPKESKE